MVYLIVENANGTGLIVGGYVKNGKSGGPSPALFTSNIYTKYPLLFRPAPFAFFFVLLRGNSVLWAWQTIICHHSYAQAVVRPFLSPL